MSIILIKKGAEKLEKTKEEIIDEIKDLLKQLDSSGLDDVVNYIMNME